ncbi:MAG: metalloenzyme [Armatimonadota bacterium]|nr:metalloenzyme [Armatimonadota bacterium]
MGVPVLVLFLDGVGLGDPDPAHNPFARIATPAIAGLLGGPLVARGIVERPGVLLVPADATLGVPGLPQSATGQTALLTGLNAPRLAGRHVTAYPTAVLRQTLAQHSVFAVARRAGAEVALANAYSPEYFAAIAGRRLKVAAVTYAAQAAGVPLRTVDDVRAARAVFHDLTNGRLRQWGHDVPELTPRASGRRLARLAANGDLTFFEFFLTDLAAHRRIPLTPDAAVAMVDELVAGVLDAAGGGTTVVLTSDHGNLEDDRSTAHTANPVPTLVVGPGREAFRRVQDLTDLAPAILTAAGWLPAVVPVPGSAS